MTRKSKGLAKPTRPQDVQQVHSCDGCTTDIPEKEALKCNTCGVWLHRYCAGIPTSHYPSIAALFICASCSLTTSNSVILELRSEIEALKAEIVELKTTVEEMKSSTKQQAPSPADEKRAGGQWTQVVKRSGRRSGGSENISQAVATRQGFVNIRQNNDTRNNPQPPACLEKEKVSAVRRIWGTRKDTSISAVAKVLKKRSSVGNKVAIQRKSQRLANDRVHWWFLVRSDESVLKVLDSEWELVKDATDSERWKLEHCQRPKRHSTAALSDEQNHENSPSQQAA